MKIYIALGSLLLVIACNPNNIDNPQNSVAITGYVGNKTGVNIQLSKALAPVGKYLYTEVAKIFYINDAKVSLYDEQQKVVDLKFVGDGKYSFNDTLVWKPTVGKNYKIVADIASYGIAESEFETFPKPAIIENVEHSTQLYTGVFSSQNLENDLQQNIAILLKPDPNKIQYFEIQYEATAKKGAQVYNFQNDAQGNNYISPQKVTECGLVNDFDSFRNIIFTTNCLINYRYYSNFLLAGTSVEKSNEKSDLTSITKLVLKVNTVSEGFHKYLINTKIQYSVDERFQEVPPSYTNIKNGIGHFYARNEDGISYVIK